MDEFNQFIKLKQLIKLINQNSMKAWGSRERNQLQSELKLLKKIKKELKKSQMNYLLLL